MLDALGWGGSNLGDTMIGSPTMVAQSMMDAAPEPGVWIMLIGGMGLLGLQFRRRRAPATAAARA